MVLTPGPRRILTVVLCLGGFSCAPATAPAPPITVELVRVAWEPGDAAVAIELTVPERTEESPLSTVEVMIRDEAGQAIFGAMQNLDDRANPIPTGAFGVLLDPSSDDRSIRNVASAGQNGQWDQTSSRGTLLKLSVGGRVAGVWGIAFRVVPRAWDSGRYLVQARAIRRSDSGVPWQALATFDFTGHDIRDVVESRCRVRPVFAIVNEPDPMPLADVGSVTLIHFERQPREDGVTMQRPAGDANPPFRFVEKERRTMKTSDFPGGLLSLEPGLYQFKHNSVSGDPPTGFYGESRVFEIEAGKEFLEVQVILYPAI